MNKQQLQQEIADLQKQLEEKQKALSAMPDKWEPKGGEFFVNVDSSITHCQNSGSYRKFADFGVEYATREQAEKAAKAMRAHNRLLAYVAEFAPDYESHKVTGEFNAFVFWSERYKHYEFDYDTNKVIGTVYMPLTVAELLVEKLNSGEVQL